MVGQSKVWGEVVSIHLHEEEMFSESKRCYQMQERRERETERKRGERGTLIYRESRPSLGGLSPKWAEHRNVDLHIQAALLGQVRRDLSGNCHYIM